MALDRADSQPIRERAAIALVKIGARETKLRLKPCLAPEADDDPQDQLRGAALLGLWPEGLATGELLPALTPPKCLSFIGN